MVVTVLTTCTRVVTMRYLHISIRARATTKGREATIRGGVTAPATGKVMVLVPAMAGGADRDVDNRGGLF